MRYPTSGICHIVFPTNSSSVTITGYRYLCNSIISWLQDNGYDYYTEEGGIAFLQDYLKTHGYFGSGGKEHAFY